MIEKTSFKGGLYSQAVIIWRSIKKTKVMKETLVEEKYKNNDIEMNT